MADFFFKAACLAQLQEKMDDSENPNGNLRLCRFVQEEYW